MTIFNSSIMAREGNNEAVENATSRMEKVMLCHPSVSSRPRWIHFTRWPQCLLLPLSTWVNSISLGWFQSGMLWINVKKKKKKKNECRTVINMQVKQKYGMAVTVRIDYYNSWCWPLSQGNSAARFLFSQEWINIKLNSNSPHSWCLSLKSLTYYCFLPWRPSCHTNHECSTEVYMSFGLNGPSPSLNAEYSPAQGECGSET